MRAAVNRVIINLDQPFDERRFECLKARVIPNRVWNL